MSRIAYVNGRYVAHRDARIHIEDRGYQFSDGAYEVIWLSGGRLVDGKWHFERLARSLGELEIALPAGSRVLGFIAAETARRNGVADGIVYLQATRGTARRDHPFPARAPRPSLVMTSRRAAAPGTATTEAGVGVLSMADFRWDRCDIKAIALIGNVLAKQRARESGAYEAWLVDRDGMVAEGGSTNAWIVTASGGLVTRAPDERILAGIARRRLIELARGAGIPVEERAFSLEEAKAAREAFITSTTCFVLPVSRIDDTVLGNGRAGGVSLELRRLYDQYVAGAT